MSFSILMYLLFPLFYQFIRSEDTLKCIRNTMLLITLIVMLQKGIELLSPDYFTMIEIAMRHTPIFCFGILMGILSMKKLSTTETLAFWGGVFSALLIFKVCGHYGVLLRDYGGDTLKILWLVAICIVLRWLSTLRKAQPVMQILRWVGKYSLELYILHIEIYVFCTSETIQPILTQFMNIDMMKVMTLVVSVMICVPVHQAIEMVKKQIYAR